MSFSLLFCFDSVLYARVFQIYFGCVVLCVRRFYLGHSIIMVADPPTKAHWKNMPITTLLKNIQKRTYTLNSLQFSAEMNTNGSKTLTTLFLFTQIINITQYCFMTFCFYQSTWFLNQYILTRGGRHDQNLKIQYESFYFTVTILVIFALRSLCFQNFWYNRNVKILLSSITITIKSNTNLNKNKNRSSSLKTSKQSVIK